MNDHVAAAAVEIEIEAQRATSVPGVPRERRADALRRFRAPAAQIIELIENLVGARPPRQAEDEREDDDAERPIHSSRACAGVIP